MGKALRTCKAQVSRNTIETKLLTTKYQIGDDKTAMKEEKII